VLGDIKLRQLQARLPVPLAPESSGERRDDVTRSALARRIRAEFEEMPGLSLTLIQASKLFGVQPDTCARILLQLSDEGVVRVRSDGQFVLRTEAA
jgi:hypothetical protein